MELFQPQTRSVLFNFPPLNFLPGERDPGLLFKNRGAELLAIPLLDGKVETTISPAAADLGFFSLGVQRLRCSCRRRPEVIETEKQTQLARTREISSRRRTGERGVQVAEVYGHRSRFAAFEMRFPAVRTGLSRSNRAAIRDRALRLESRSASEAIVIIPGTWFRCSHGRGSLDDVAH